jgi:dipeptidase E
MLYFGGGGSEDRESKLWDLVFHAPKRIVVWPYAMPIEPRPGSTMCQKGTMNWVTRALAKWGEFDIRLGDTAPDFGLVDADILVIPGGNTFHLLAFMRENNVFDEIDTFLKRGGKIYGGSAGALIMGRDIGICDLATGGLDPNDIGMVDTKALDLIGNAVVFPHLEPGANHDTCQKWANNHDTLVWGIPEAAGVSVDEEGNAYCTGPEAVVIFRPNAEPMTMSPGATWSTKA